MLKRLNIDIFTFYGNIIITYLRLFSRWIPKNIILNFLQYLMKYKNYVDIMYMNFIANFNPNLSIISEIFQLLPKKFPVLFCRRKKIIFPHVRQDPSKG